MKRTREPHVPTTPPLTGSEVETPRARNNLRALCKELIGKHTTEILVVLTEGMLSKNTKTALKYLTFVSDRAEGKPVQTTRVAEVDDPLDEELSKLTPEELEKELELLLTSLRSKRTTK